MAQVWLKRTNGRWYDHDTSFWNVVVPAKRELREQEEDAMVEQQYQEHTLYQDMVR